MKQRNDTIQLESSMHFVKKTWPKYEEFVKQQAS